MTTEQKASAEEQAVPAIEMRKVDLADAAPQKISGRQYKGGETGVEVASHVAARLVKAERATYSAGKAGSSDALAGVDFASPAAEDAARKAGLRAALFADQVPDGATGYTADQVRDLASTNTKG